MIDKKFWKKSLDLYQGTGFILSMEVMQNAVQAAGLMKRF